MKRVAAYCRVSTDKDDQANSLASQKKFFFEYIDREPMWMLEEIYVDEGITGTSTTKRHAFNQMISDAQNHRFDLIITKEISRFARNTLDSIYYTRKLKELGIGVIFMNDNINTLDADAELRLTIMSSIAQEESRKTSERVKWGQKRRMEQGVVFGRDMLGYDVRNGKLTVNEDGAKTVRLIFHKFVNEDKGTHVIARELREAGIHTATYMKKWSNTAILRVLRNEKYCGDLVQKKTYTPSYLNHKKKYNHGEEEFVVQRNHHEPIITRELFDKAQRELARRSLSDEQKAKHSNRYCFSGKVKCGVCGCSYVSRTKKRKDGSVYKAWRCHEAARHGSIHMDKAGNEIGCNNRSFNDNDLKLIMQQVVKNLMLDKKTIITNLTQIIQTVLKTDNQQDEIRKLQERSDVINEKRQSLIELYLSKGISKSDLQSIMKKYDDEIANIKKEKETLDKFKTAGVEKEQLLKSVADKIRGIACGDVWDDTFYRKILDKIVVHKNNVIDIHLQLISERWSYLVCNTVQLNKARKTMRYTGKEDNNRHIGTSAGTEELAHLEMVGTMVRQLLQNASIEEIEKAGAEGYYTDHGRGVYPQGASGSAFSACAFQSKGDPVTDLYENLAAEQKARSTYEYLLNLADDPDVIDPLRFLREREVVHFQRFGESLRIVKDYLGNRKRFSAPPPRPR